MREGAGRPRPDCAAGTWLAFDYGDKRLGVAGGQTITRTTNPIAAIPQRRPRRGPDSGPAWGPDWGRVGRIVAAWRPCGMVVGMPYTEDGRPTPLIKRIRRFTRELKNRYGVPVHAVDERLSSHAARATAKMTIRAEMRRDDSHAARVTAKRGDNIDAIAAALILQTWFSQTASR